MMTDAEVPKKVEEFTQSLDQLTEKTAEQQEWRIHEKAVHHIVENMLYDFLEENELL